LVRARYVREAHRPGRVCAVVAADAVDGLQERESLGPTGVGHGIALPHARLDAVDRIVAVFLRLERPLDYDSVDRQPVDLIFGLPEESEEDQRLTLDLARWITARGGKVRAHLFSPLPGTPLAGSQPAPLADDVEACLGKMALGGRLTGSWSAESNQW
jgi:hypothetical protein